MNWKKRKYHGKNERYSLAKKLKDNNKTTEEFETILNNLSLEEVIGLKLELSSRVFGGKSYGLPLWNSMRDITNDALLKYALSACRTKKEAARFLGLNSQNFNKLLKKYNVESFFEKNEKTIDN
jgi:DNA-binding NtrC family response regulator